MTDAIVVLSTTASRAEADRIAEALVERRLAGCVQIVGPIASVYRWQEKVEQSEEWLCVIKSRQSAFAQLKTAIAELHSYETPEIIALDVSGGSADYLRWLQASVGP